MLFVIQVLKILLRQNANVCAEFMQQAPTESLVVAVRGHECIYARLHIVYELLLRFVLFLRNGGLGSCRIRGEKEKQLSSEWRRMQISETGTSGSYVWEDVTTRDYGWKNDVCVAPKRAHTF